RHATRPRQRRAARKPVRIGYRRGTDLAADALQVARKAVESSEAKPDLLGAALLELASARVLLRVNPDDATIGRLTQAVEDIHTVGQRPWIIEANLVKCRALLRAGSADKASGALDIAERLSSDDGMILQKTACNLERLQVDASNEHRPLDAARVADVIASAVRLGLTFIAYQAAKLSSPY